MSKDYYHILGINKSASPEEIKRAFFKLANKHHPDKAGGNADKFKEINEAYQILNNPQKRAQYDQFGTTFEQTQARGGFSGFEGFRDFSDFAEAMKNGQNSGGFEFDLGDIFGDAFGFGGGTRKGRKKRGKDIELEMEIDFREAVFGAEKNIALDKYIICSECRGSGNEPGSKFITCSTCKGRGQITHVQKTFFGQFRTASICPDCGGQGRKPEKICPKCKGEGRHREKKELKIKIPAGIDHGQTIKISGQGEAGTKNSEPGDLYITFNVKKDREFKRQGYDIFSKAFINFSQAVLGDKIKVKTLEGDVWLKIPSGAESGKIFKLKGKGVTHLNGYAKGDQLVEVIIKIPENLTKKQKQLLEELENEGL
ncbi:MAG: molecular chaperone DnaJ [Parcubacteria group bacterium Athens1014_10]|nr:MAG: molecular chaperone DnaJ [Parcubacteria group bacterium Athens1014_10]TSD05973.1 MAG: molecular chaperone DnaJ [Parcubacteria group bacterium Athens0714_12]